MPGLSRALLWIYRALLWIYRALLWIYRALLWIYGALLWIYRALLWIYRALLWICSLCRRCASACVSAFESAFALKLCTLRSKSSTLHSTCAPKLTRHCNTRQHKLQHTHCNKHCNTPQTHRVHSSFALCKRKARLCTRLALQN